MILPRASRVVALLVLLVALPAPLPCQPVAPEREAADSAHVDVGRLVLVGGVTTGAFIYGHAVIANLWWKGERSPFHFDWEHDWRYALGADKLGHFYFPYLMAGIYEQAFRWTGIERGTSLWLASGLALTYQSYIEVRDGFSKAWGFSWGDFGADLLGAAYPVARHYLPALGIVGFKMSFLPSEKYKAGAYGSIIDDYESSYHWLSLDVHALLPEAWRDSYPAWINLAIGHSVKDLDGRGGGHHELYLALDWNLDALPSCGGLLDLLKHNLNVYHLPAPAVRILPDVVWYGVRL